MNNERQYDYPTQAMFSSLQDKIPQLARGQVWCRQCGRTQHTDSAKAMRQGWPKCCGYTMTIDSPEEQKRLSASVPNRLGNRLPASGAAKEGEEG